ncbi:hypothetical protein Ga0074812_14813 [Parafrankia irregularis]|uniref:Uncharacterized protein n=1 Tax=Parafrankia irregularis TaxID=795642 RepID=A0A0S4QZ33_9ACTN|nr:MULTISPECIES: hypothetical protein [Parafrankia]MBE3206791.1 hypothetical protein [Parafrankia sp. CH37]CUU60813.1 hypothetical protein Ga0074812_14813 [Parafrankia irregularis]
MIVLFVFLVLLPGFAGLYWLSRCGAATRSTGRLCYRRRRGLLSRCHDHGFQLIARGDLLAILFFAVAYGGFSLYKVVN